MSSDGGIVFDHNVPGQRGSVGKDDLVSNSAVVRHMGIGHDVIVVSDHRLSAPRDRGPVQCDVLPDDIVVTDDQKCFLPLVGKGLRGFPDGGELEDLTVLADLGSFADEHVRPDSCPCADRYPFFNDDVRADLNPLADLRLWIDDRSRMNHFSSPNMAKRSASATNLSSTKAFPLNPQMDWRCRVTSNSRRSWSPGTTGFLKRTLSNPRK